MLSIELEMDSFNNHECMAHLCAVIKHLTSEIIVDSTIKVKHFAFNLTVIILLFITNFIC